MSGFAWDDTRGLAVFDSGSCSCQHDPGDHDDGYGCTVRGCECLAGWLFDDEMTRRGTGMIKFSVNGIPAPKGSKTRNRAGAVYESSKAVRPWTEAVRAETQRAAETPLDGPVMVLIGFRLARPAGHYGAGRNAATLRPSAPGWPAGKPDIDKLARAVLDGLKAGGAYRDDAQVITLAASKAYASTPGADIEITEVTR